MSVQAQVAQAAGPSRSIHLRRNSGAGGSRVLAGLVAMLVLGGAGCGSSASDDSADTTKETATAAPAQSGLSKPEFTAAADKVCGRLDSDTKDLVERSGELQDSYADAPDEAALDKRVREVVGLNRRFVELFRASNEELAGLRGPDDSTLMKYLGERDAYADGVARLAAAQSGFADATAEGQVKANKKIVSAGAAGERSSATLKRLARAYGFKVCHQGG